MSALGRFCTIKSRYQPAANNSPICCPSHSHAYCERKQGFKSHRVLMLKIQDAPRNFSIVNDMDAGSEAPEAIDPTITCASCRANCCRLEVMIFGEDDVPPEFTEMDRWGGRLVRRARQAHHALRNLRTSADRVSRLSAWRE